MVFRRTKWIFTDGGERREGKFKEVQHVEPLVYHRSNICQWFILSYLFKYDCLLNDGYIKKSTTILFTVVINTTRIICDSVYITNDSIIIIAIIELKHTED